MVYSPTVCYNAQTIIALRKNKGAREGPATCAKEFMSNETRQLKSTAMAVSAGILILAGASTLIPWASVGEANVIGYKSLCPFAPFSTLICMMGANVLLTLRKRLAASPEE